MKTQSPGLKSIKNRKNFWADAQLFKIMTRRAYLLYASRVIRGQRGASLRIIKLRHFDESGPLK